MKITQFTYQIFVLTILAGFAGFQCAALNSVISTVAQWNGEIYKNRLNIDFSTTVEMTNRLNLSNNIKWRTTSTFNDVGSDL